MRFLVDAQLPPGLCRWLHARGHDAEHVFALLEHGATDRRIAELAEASQLILISKDEDFLHLRLPDRFALVWLRCGNATNRALGEWLEPRWPVAEGLLRTGERVIELR